MASYSGTIRIIERTVSTLWKFGIQIYDNIQIGRDGDQMHRFQYGYFETDGTDGAATTRGIPGALTGDAVFVSQGSVGTAPLYAAIYSDGTLTVTFGSAPAVGTEINYIIINGPV